MSDIVRIGGKLALAKLLTRALRVFGATGIPQRIAIEVFTELLSNAFKSAIQGEDRKEYDFSESVLGVDLEFPGSVLALPANCFGVRFDSAGSRVVRFGYSSVPDLIQVGSASLGRSDSSWLDETPLQLGSQYVLVPGSGDAESVQIDKVYAYIEVGSRVSVSALIRVAK